MADVHEEPDSGSDRVLRRALELETEGTHGEARYSRLERLRNEVRSGTYEMSTDRIADALLRTRKYDLCCRSQDSPSATLDYPS